MTTSDRVLVILLRFLGVCGLFALVAVAMPVSWMAATHRWLGLGDMPNAPVVVYLARSVSALYALFGILCLVVAPDLDRYRPLVRFMGMAFAVMGLAYLGLEVAAGLPWWWSASEGPGRVAFGMLMFFLARPNDRAGLVPNRDDKPKPLRRWHQFRLRTLFLVVAIVALPCGLYKWLAEAKQRERAAVVAIRALGGYVRYDWEAEGKNTPSAPKWLRVILGDDWFGDVAIVSVGTFKGRGLTDGDLVHLDAFKRLQMLELFCESSGHVTDVGLARLKGMNTLERLFLGNTHLTDAGMANITGLNRLQGLNLYESDITDNGLVNLKDLPELETLSLAGCCISDSGLVHVRSLPKLQELNLADTMITDAGLVHLQPLERLAILRLTNTQVTDEGVNQLQEALPKCEIIR